VLVPARLLGLEWVGDPNASRPCACKQLREIERLAGERGALVAEGQVGDPEVVPAVDDALAGWDADEIVVFEPRHRVALTRRLDLANRLGRRTGLPVSRFRLPRRRRHCTEK
jgi:hypothetical protein